MRILLLFYLRDLFNFCRFGFKSPRALALMFVDPRTIQFVQAQCLHKRKYTGWIVAANCGGCIETLVAMDKYHAIYQKVSPQGNCLPVKDLLPIYFDGGHLSERGSRLLTPMFLQSITAAGDAP